MQTECDEHGHDDEVYRGLYQTTDTKQYMCTCNQKCKNNSCKLHGFSQSIKNAPQQQQQPEGPTTHEVILGEAIGEA